MALADILNYTGNAALAGQADSVIDLSPALKSLDGLNERRNQVADIDYRQKIADRDRTFSAIANMQADFDKVPPEYRAGMKDQIKKISDLLMQPGAFEDGEKIKQVQDEMSSFQETNAYAKTNYKTVKEEEMAAAKEEDTELRTKMLEHISKQKKAYQRDPHAIYDPFKKNTAIDFKAIIPKGKTASKVNSSNGVNDNVVNYIDPISIIEEFDAKMKDVKDGTNFKKQINSATEQFMTEDRNPEARTKELISWNNKINEANSFITEPNLKIKTIPNAFINAYNNGGSAEFSDAGGVDDISREDFQKAMVVATSFSQKESTVVNEERSKALLQASQIKENDARAKKALADIETDKMNATSTRITAISGRIRADAAAAAQKNKNKLSEQEKTDATMFSNTFIDKTKTAVSTNAKGVKSFMKFVAVGDLPGGFNKLNGIMIDDKGKLTTGALDPFVSKGGMQYYKVKYHDPQTNEEINIDNRVLKDGYALTLKQNNTTEKIYSMDNYISSLAKKGLLKPEYGGKNGIMNGEAIGMAARAIASKGKKGENLVNDENPNE